ncbi:MAG TPA: hypothetical protein VGG99_27885 [Acetobacteraceae bacterium]|jgi:hypothetical protein
MSVLRSTLSFGFLLPPPAHRHVRRHGLRAAQGPGRRQIFFAYGLAALALGLVLLVCAAGGTQAPGASDKANAASPTSPRLEMHRVAAPLALPMPVP